MGNEELYIITVRFPSWGYEKDDEYPAFGIKYLIQITLDEKMEGAEYDKEGYIISEDFSEEKNIVKKFKKLYSYRVNNGKKEFDGEILFIERQENLNVLSKFH